MIISVRDDSCAEPLHTETSKTKARDALDVIPAFVVTKKKHHSTEIKSDFVEPLLPIPNKQREHPVTQSFLPLATEMEACFISITLIVFHES